MNLSKSRYVKGIQCPKMLWLDDHKPELAKATVGESVFENGNMVGDLARHYFGDYKLVDFANGLQSMIDETKKYIADGTDNIAEASFKVDNLFCSVDLLHKNGNNYDIYEVKSSTGSFGVYINDVAFQYYVLTKAGVPIGNAFLMYLNSDYERHGDLDLKQLFIIEDLTESALLKQPEVEENIKAIIEFADVPDEPVKDLELCCDKPYECAYKAYCGKHLPEKSVFDIAGMFAKTKYALYHKGIVSFEDVYNAQPKMNDSQRRQVETAVLHLPTTVDKDGIKKFLDTITYPVYYLDFETFQQPVPMFDGAKPYMQLPFQYSLHVQKTEGGSLEHFEYLGDGVNDPRRGLAEQLCHDIPLNVCTMAYNMGFEKGRIKEMAALYPDLSEHLMNIHDHIIDLMIPFKNQAYYSEALEGSYSIKYVLPAVCPGDPELNYHNLKGVHNGSEAMSTYAGLLQHSAEEIAEIRDNLLKYCCLDTLAMVKIVERLIEMAKTD